MEVKINIEASQIGDTVIDLFKSLPKDKKEELTLEVLREWVKSPEFFETENYKQTLLDKFKNGNMQPSYYSTKYNKDTPDQTIIQDYNYKKYLEEYRTSKQIMVEEIKTEIIKYGRQFIKSELLDSETINKIKQESYDQIALEFPKIIYESLVIAFSGNLISLQNQILSNTMMNQHTEHIMNQVRTKLNL